MKNKVFFILGLFLTIVGILTFSLLRVNSVTGNFVLPLFACSIFSIAIGLITSLFSVVLMFNSSSDNVRHDSRVQREKAYLQALYEGKELGQVTPTIYLKAPYSQAGIAEHLVHDFRGYVIDQKVTGNKNYTLLRARIPARYLEDFQRSVRNADYVLAAYAGSGASSHALKTEVALQPSIQTEGQRRPNDIVYGLKYISTGSGWGRSPEERERNEIDFLRRLYDYGERAGVIRDVIKMHPQMKVPYASSEVSDPVIGFLISWGNAQAWGNLYRTLKSDPERGRLLLEEVNKIRQNVPFKDIEAVRIEFERHKDAALQYIESKVVEKEMGRIEELGKKLAHK